MKVRIQLEEKSYLGVTALELFSFRLFSLSSDSFNCSLFAVAVFFFASFSALKFFSQLFFIFFPSFFCFSFLFSWSCFRNISISLFTSLLSVAAFHLVSSFLLFLFLSLLLTWAIRTNECCQLTMSSSDSKIRCVNPSSAFSVLYPAYCASFFFEMREEEEDQKTFSTEDLIEGWHVFRLPFQNHRKVRLLFGIFTRDCCWIGVFSLSYMN